MVLLFHITAALSSMVLSTLALASPSRRRINSSYYLVVLTLISGTYIIISRHLAIKSVCLSGLLYIGFTVSALVAASHKLGRQTQKAD